MDKQAHDHWSGDAWYARTVRVLVLRNDAPLLVPCTRERALVGGMRPPVTWFDVPGVYPWSQRPRPGREIPVIRSQSEDRPHVSL